MHNCRQYASITKSKKIFELDLGNNCFNSQGSVFLIKAQNRKFPNFWLLREQIFSNIFYKIQQMKYASNMTENQISTLFWL